MCESHDREKRSPFGSSLADRLADNIQSHTFAVLCTEAAISDAAAARIAGRIGAALLTFMREELADSIP